MEAEMRARRAYRENDVELSMEVHDMAEEKHAESGDLVKSLVFGGLDGIITTFAIVAAVAGAGLSTSTVILMGVANLVADGISMGLGDYLSEKAEKAYLQYEVGRERWEMENYFLGEKREMIDIYKKKGLTEEDATSVMETLAKYPDVFLELMCVDELGFIKPSQDDYPPWKKGAVTMIAFDLFGAVPVLVYVLAKLVGEPSKDVLFAIAGVATAVTMFFLGVTKASFTKQAKVKAGFLMLLNGAAAAIAAYGIGALLERLLATKGSCR